MSDLHELNYPLEMIWGSSLERGFVFKDGSGDPIDLTGYTAEVHIRERIKSDEPLVSLSSESETDAGSGLEITADEGKVVLTITDQESDNLPGESRQERLVWDLKLTPANGDLSRVYFRESDFIVYPASTR